MKKSLTYMLDTSFKMFISLQGMQVILSPVNFWTIDSRQKFVSMSISLPWYAAKMQLYVMASIDELNLPAKDVPFSEAFFFGKRD